MLKTFEDQLIYLEEKGIVRSSLTFGKQIESFSASGGEKISLPEGAVVLPGFLDEHIHGAGGADVMDGTGQALSEMAKALSKEGTTSFLAATMTQSPENITRALSAVKEYLQTQPENLCQGKKCPGADPLTGARLLGVHLEGPFLSAAYKGAQPAAYIVKPDVEQFERYRAASGDNIRIVTLAPEEEGAEELICHLAERKIIVSLGHCAAGYADVARATLAGASQVTHTFNAQSPLHHREIGTAGAALLSDTLSCELIADTVHVSVPAIKLLIKCKTYRKIVLITDAIRAKGLGDGVSELGGQKVFVKGAEARLPDGTIAGSVLQMNRAVQNMVEKAGMTLPQAADCASYNPARNLGLSDRIGGIAVGKLADLTVLSKNYDVLMTIVDGEIVYRSAF